MPENSKNLALKYGYFDKLRQVITYSFKYTLRKLKLKRLSMDRVTELFSTKNQKLKHIHVVLLELIQDNFQQNSKMPSYKERSLNC